LNSTLLKRGWRRNQNAFLHINKIGSDYIDIHLVLTEPFEDTLCFYIIDNLANRFLMSQARLHTRDDITDELKKYMGMAYEAGNRGHIAPRRTTMQLLLQKQADILSLRYETSYPIIISVIDLLLFKSAKRINKKS
jgi:hypothetical protein